MESNQIASGSAVKLGTVIKEQYPDLFQAPNKIIKETAKPELPIKPVQLSPDQIDKKEK